MTGIIIGLVLLVPFVLGLLARRNQPNLEDVVDKEDLL